ncbi:hypothetical protein [uncultured Sulfitobacter sp.]|uniref:hypothetical protein n=1 Tax=uncultured Sulfitobacter sp. TaxID=191468 RepID=UPI0026160142|nr:hypothetical protein [uncultured Sulfitobacter sp.]
MTYQSTATEYFSARMPARGQVTSTTPFLSARTSLAQLGQLLARAGTAMMNASSGAARVARVQALNAKTDDELKAMGIARADIVHHVFRDYYYA